MMKTKDEEGFGQRVKTCFTHLLEGARGRGREGLFARSWARARRGQSPQTASSPCHPPHHGLEGAQLGRPIPYQS